MDGLLHCLAGFGQPTKVLQCDAEVVIRPCKFRVERDSASVGSRRLDKFALVP